MVSHDAIKAAYACANKYIVGSKEVGPYRMIQSDYQGYVNSITPVIDEFYKAYHNTMEKRKALGLSVVS